MVNQRQWEQDVEVRTVDGNDTQDYVFLLSGHADLSKYFPDSASAKCTPTEYAIAKGASTKGAGAPWWLRDPGLYQNMASGVDAYGEWYYYFVPCDFVVVRPVIRLDLKSDNT